MEAMKTAVNAYQSVHVDAAVLGASPHELIAKLLARAILAVSDAKKYMQAGNINAKGQEIKIATAIIADGLCASLDMEAGGDIATNLEDLYKYMLQRLLTAHAENDVAILDEVSSLLQEIKTGWDGIQFQV